MKNSNNTSIIPYITRKINSISSYFIYPVDRKYLKEFETQEEKSELYQKAYAKGVEDTKKLQEENKNESESETESEPEQVPHTKKEANQISNLLYIRDILEAFNLGDGYRFNLSEEYTNKMFEHVEILEKFKKTLDFMVLRPEESRLEDLRVHLLFDINQKLKNIREKPIPDKMANITVEQLNGMLKQERAVGTEIGRTDSTLGTMQYFGIGVENSKVKPLLEDMQHRLYYSGMQDVGDEAYLAMRKRLLDSIKNKIQECENFIKTKDSGFKEDPSQGIRGTTSAEKLFPQNLPFSFLPTLMTAIPLNKLYTLKNTRKQGNPSKNTAMNLEDETSSVSVKKGVDVGTQTDFCSEATSTSGQII